MQPSPDRSPLTPDPAGKEDIMRPSPPHQAPGDSQAVPGDGEQPGDRRPRG